jgi:hypothetical protein
MNRYTAKYIISNKEIIDLDDILRHHKYPETVLEKLVLHTNFNTLLVYQKLSLDFVVKYIMNPRYHQEDNETTISYKEIEFFQGYTKEQVEERIDNLTYFAFP